MSRINEKTQMTNMQFQIYQFIAKTIEEKGYPPSVREIGDEVGLKSPSTVHFHLANLASRGLISKDAGKGRAIRLLKPIESFYREEMYVDEVAQPVNKVPVVGNVAAGTPILAQECIEDYLTFDTGGKEDEYFALRVRGESMINAGILPGDYVIVHQQENARNYEIVVAMLDDEATVKTLYRTAGETMLLPANDDYKPIDGKNAKILGKVTSVIRNYR